MHPAAFQTALIGQRISRLVAQEHWHEGQLSDRFNVLFACVGERWLRFFIDAGVFFWSAVPAPNPPPSADGHEYALAEHPFMGTVREAVFSSAADSAELRIVLSDGSALCLRNEADRSTVTFQPPNHALQRTEAGR